MPADPWETLRRQYALRDRPRLLGRRLISQDNIVPISSTPVTSPSPPTPIPSPPSVGTNTQTFLNTGLLKIRRVNALPYTTTPAWPPDGAYNITNTPMTPPIGNTSGEVRKDYIIGGDGLATYFVDICCLYWDTSGLPDTAMVTGATFSATATLSDPFGGGGGKWDMEGRSIVADWQAWTGVFADWSVDIGTSAIAGVPIAETPADGPYEIELQGASANVNKTGLTYLRMGITGGAPSRKSGQMGQSPGANSYNSIAFRGNYSGDSFTGSYAPEKGPHLIVTYA